MKQISGLAAVAEQISQYVGLSTKSQRPPHRLSYSRSLISDDS